MKNTKTLIAKPIGNQIIVAVNKPQEKSVGGIVLPSSYDKDGISRGTVVSVGGGHLLSNGSLANMETQVGDEVMFITSYGVKVEIDGEEYLVIKESELLLVL